MLQYNATIFKKESGESNICKIIYAEVSQGIKFYMGNQISNNKKKEYCWIWTQRLQHLKKITLELYRKLQYSVTDITY